MGDFFKAGNVTSGIEPRVQTLLGHPPILQRPVPGLVQRHHIRATQTEIRAQWRALGIPLAFNHNPHDPAPRARRINNQIQPAAIAMPPSPKILHQLLGQLAGRGHLKYHIPYHVRKAYERNQKKSNAIIEGR